MIGWRAACGSEMSRFSRAEPHKSASMYLMVVVGVAAEELTVKRDFELGWAALRGLVGGISIDEDCERLEDWSVGVSA